MRPGLSRRHFLNLVGIAGGSAAVLQTSLALGLPPETGPLALADVQPPSPGNQRVLILGAGISGLSVAYELERKGFDCTVIEASHRIGGRNLTLRSGDEIDEMGYKQVCRFDNQPHLYFNAGPARIPGHHKLVMHYCRELKIPLETYVNDNRNAYTQDDRAFDGRAIRAPALAGLNDWYLVRQLMNFRDGTRGSHPDDTYGAQMRAASETLSDDDAVHDVVAYIMSLQSR